MLSIIKNSRMLILEIIAHLNKITRRSNKILAYCMVLSFFTTQAQQAPGGELKLNNEQGVTQQEKKFIKTYFEAERYKLLEEYSHAISEYQKCTSILPREPSPYYQIGKIQLYVLNELENAEYYIKEAISLNLNNEWGYYDLLTIYGIQNNLIKQQDTYKQLIDIDPENQRYYFESIRTLKDLKQYRPALKLIKKTEKEFGISNESLLLAKDIYIQQNNLRESEKIGKKLIKRSSQFYTVLAEIYMHFSNYEKAVETYTKLLKISPEHPTAIIALYKIYFNKKDLKNEELYLSKIASSAHISTETKKEIFYNILINNNLSKYPSFKAIIEDAVLLHPEEPLFHLILGDIYAKKEHYEQATTHYYSSLYSGFIKDDYVYNKLVQMYWQQNKTDSVLKTTQEAIQRFPFSPEFYYYQGLAFSNQEQYKPCIEILLKGKDFVFDNDLLKSDFYSLIGDAYHKLNDHAASDQGYTNALKHNPNNTLVLNNYSYYLSNREENLTKAKTMITKCLELTISTPNASYIDTYAWVLYKLGEYELAKAQIEHAISINKNSPVLLEHYGDILHKLGMIDDAVTYWKKASELDQDNSELFKKINKNNVNE